jgi:hypothetical protein
LGVCGGEAAVVITLVEVETITRLEPALVTRGSIGLDVLIAKVNGPKLL